MSEWLLVSCGSDEIRDLARSDYRLFSAEGGYPSSSELQYQFRSLLGLSARPSGDVLRMSRCYLIPADSMEDLGYIGGEVTYKRMKDGDG